MEMRALVGQALLSVLVTDTIFFFSKRIQTLILNEQNSSESIMHSLRDCPFVKNLWLALGFDNINFYLGNSLVTWLRQGAFSANNHLFFAALWWIWCARNSLCMENEIISIFSLKVKIYNLTALLRFVFSPALSTNIGDRYATWHPEESMAVVLNVDGSNFGNPGISGFGGVIRRNDGTWLYGFAGNVGISTVIHVELLALYYGLKAAWERGYRDVICYSDSTLTVQLVSTMVNP